MRAITLLYHDVVVGGDYRASGFQGGDADIYKLDRAAFERHLTAIAAAGVPGSTVTQLLTAPAGGLRLFLSFDDGGASAYHVIADLLERRNWRGHFFIPTDYVGRYGFLTRTEIRGLDERGHVIGSHSASHPPRISHLPEGRILEEWVRSTEALSAIVGHATETASVPGGFYSKTVARAAARAGIRMLFNSEPVTTVRLVEGCWIAGRFGLQRGDSESAAAAIAAGALAPRLRQWAFWNAKKLVKAAGGEIWLALRKRLLAR